MPFAIFKHLIVSIMYSIYSINTTVQKSNQNDSICQSVKINWKQFNFNQYFSGNYSCRFSLKDKLGTFLVCCLQPILT